MRPSSTARRYAEAAYAVAQERNEVRSWLADLQAARDRMADERIGLYFKDPNVATEEKLDSLETLFPGVNEHVSNLLRMLVVRERMQLIPSIYAEFLGLDRAARGILEAHVTVARQYGDAERTDIARRLSASTGKEVEVHLSVEPSILGGIIVRIGDRLIDASVAGRLQRLRHDMAV